MLAVCSATNNYEDMRPVIPFTIRELAKQVESKGSQMRDARVSGSVITLEEGKLSIMVGGNWSALGRARPILEGIGPKVTHVGGNGLPVSMKIATNLSFPVKLSAFNKGVLLAERRVIPRETEVEVHLTGGYASPR